MINLCFTEDRELLLQQLFANEVLTYLLAHSSTYSLTHSLIYPRTHSLLLTYLLTHSQGLVFLLLASKLYIDYSDIREKSLELLVFVVRYIDQMSRSLVCDNTAIVNLGTHSPTHLLTHLLTYSPTHSLTHLPTHSLIE